MSEPTNLRFRGGVRFLPDEGKWHIIVEVNGVQYLDEEEYDSEEEAMVVYREARKGIVESLGISKGPDLEFDNPIGCSFCHTTFRFFKDYDAHLPCPKENKAG